MMRGIGRALAVTTTLCLAPLALHAQSTPPATPPGCSAPEHRQFDFWIGEWTVTDSAGIRVFGHNRIVSEDGGCLLLERWISAGTGPNVSTGHSVNAYDRATKQWGQDWVGNDGTVLHIRGGLVDGRMVLASANQRITWTLQPDGRVRQLWESSTDGGKTWTAAFDGWYRRSR